MVIEFGFISFGYGFCCRLDLYLFVVGMVSVGGQVGFIVVWFLVCLCYFLFLFLGRCIVSILERIGRNINIGQVSSQFVFYLERIFLDLKLQVFGKERFFFYIFFLVYVVKSYSVKGIYMLVFSVIQMFLYFFVEVFYFRVFEYFFLVSSFSWLICQVE